MFGIPSNDIIYMCYGLDVESATTEFDFGIREKFIIFDGKTLINKIKEVTISNSTLIQHKQSNDVNGFICNMNKSIIHKLNHLFN